MENKKELKDLYKSRVIVGGVYRITCSGSGRTWLKSTKDLQGQANKFRFAIQNHTCPEPGMRADWLQHGAASFSFAILEELEKRNTQTDAEFSEDIRTLFKMWLEKSENGSLGQ
ncbi:MAG: GIY-YIG nuclease family protein [Clostridia bacterium]|nr:GIY-YIG nuclease family protein [Clostridia bacterium]